MTTPHEHPRARRHGWLLAFVLMALALRLVHIDAPPVGHHGWRQADTASVARNFHHHGYRLFWPQIDWAVPGYVEMEFPLFPWIASLAYAVWGENVAIARLLAAAASTAAVALVYQLVASFVGRREALWAAFLWAVLPLSVYFGRAVMPESWMLASSLAGVYLFWLGLERSSRLLLLAAAAALALACLLKPTSLLLGLPLAWLCWQRHGRAALARAELWLVALAVAASVAAWYWHAYRIGVTYGASFGLFSGPGSKLGHWGLLLEPAFFKRVFVDFFAARIVTWFGIVPFAIGLLIPRRSSRERLFDVWLAAVVIVLLIAGGASSVHEYYSLPLLVPAVAFMARGITWVTSRSRALAALLVLGILVTSAARLVSYLEREGSADPGVAEDMRVADLLGRETAPEDLIVSCNHTDPTWLYLARRQGFGHDCDLLDKNALAALERRGAHFLVARHSDLEGEAGSALREHLTRLRSSLHDDGSLLLVDLRASRPKPLRPLALALASGNDSEVSPWRIASGEWREAADGLAADPERRRIAAGIDVPACGICAMRATVESTPASDEDWRRRFVSLKGWWSGDSWVETVLDLSARRIQLRQVENGSVVHLAQRSWSPARASLVSLAVGFDNFDFEVRLNGQPFLVVPNRAERLPHGRFAIEGFNVRLAVKRVEVGTSMPPLASAVAEARMDSDPDLTGIDVSPVWSGHPVGFDLVTADEYQYVGFFDPERRMTIAQRLLGTPGWTVKRLPETVKWDSHNGISLEVDRDGYVHVSGNMHGDRLVYFRSLRPHDLAVFEKPRMVGSLERNVSYPQFVKDAGGNLFFHYRHGTSGSGSNILNGYDLASRTWARLPPGLLFDGEGTASAYVNGPALGPDGYLHMVWVWRDTPRASTNHDLSYARSRDLVRWETADGSPLGLPFTPRSAGVVVDDVAVGEGLVGGGFGVGWDSRLRPIVSYVKYGPSGSSQLHSARWQEGSWSIVQTSDWSYRWELDQTGTLPWEVFARPVATDACGRLTQAFSHRQEGRGVWILDEATLRPVESLPEPELLRRLRQVESEFPAMEVRPFLFDRAGRYFLRWETLPVNRDRPREPPLPPPSMLRVYRRAPSVCGDGARPQGESLASTFSTASSASRNHST